MFIRNILSALAAACCLLISSAAAQEAGKKKEPPQPQTVELLTKDQVRLQATFYPGTMGKKTVPIIVVHDEKSDRHDFHDFALALQAEGHAVIVPDMRGYGESTKVKMGPGLPDRIISAEKMPRIGYQLMIKDDLDRVKSFLKEQNDEGELNLNALAVIGVGNMGSTLATNWTVRDWAWRDLAAIKQGRDVRALVLISPGANFNGIPLPASLLLLAKARFAAADRSSDRISFFLVAGGRKPGAAPGKSSELKEAETYANKISSFHPEPQKDDIIADKTLFSGEVDTSLQGAELLKEATTKKLNVKIEGFKEVPLDTMIITFLDWRLVRKMEAENDPAFPWSERALPGD